MELLSQATADNSGLFPPMNETLYVVNFNDLTIEKLECDEYSPILFRRKGSRIFESTKSLSQQVVRSVKEGEEVITKFLTERVKESWDEYAQWNRKLNDHLKATNAEIKTLSWVTMQGYRY